MGNQTWLSKILASVAGWFSKASPEIHDGAIIATNIVNVIKKAEQSNIGQIVETGLEMVIPASTGLVNAFKLFLPQLLSRLNWIVDVTAPKASLQASLIQASQYLNNLKTIDQDTYAAQLNSLNALIQKWISDNTGTGLTMPQALINPQAVYNPELVVNIPSTDVTDAANPKQVEAPGTNAANVAGTENQNIYAQLSTEQFETPINHNENQPAKTTGTEGEPGGQNPN